MSKGQVFLWTGPEWGNKVLEIQKIRAALSASQSLEETTFYAGEDSAVTIADSVLSGALFSDARLFIVKNAEIIKKKDDVKLITGIIENVPPSTTLIFISDDASIEKNIEKAAGQSKKIFYEMFENQKSEWVVNFFKKANLVIEKDAVDIILEMVENTTDALRSQCGNIALFCKDGVITADFVERLLSKTRVESTFTLFHAIAEGNLEKSLAVLHTLLGAKEASVSIFAGLVWCWKKLRDYKTLVQEGGADDLGLKKIGLASQKARADYISAARIYSIANVNFAIALTAETDASIRKSGTLLEKTMLELYLYRVIIRRR